MRRLCRNRRAAVQRGKARWDLSTKNTNHTNENRRNSGGRRAWERRRRESLCMKTKNSPGDAPNDFIAKHAADVIGQLHGFDRLRLQGTLPPLYYPPIMQQHLWEGQVLHKDFKEYAAGITMQMRAQIEAAARSLGRPIQYLQSSR